MVAEVEFAAQLVKKLGKIDRSACRAILVHAILNYPVGRCSVPVELDLQGDFGGSFTNAINGLQCVITDATNKLIDKADFTLSGIGFKAVPGQPGVYCSAQIPTVGALCATGLKPPFTNISAKLQNEAQVLQTVRDGLRSVVGDAATLKTVELKGNAVVAVADVTLPGLGQVNDLEFEITNKGFSGSFQPAFRTAVNRLIGTKSWEIAGVQVSNITVLNDAPLAIKGNISYGGFSALAGC